MTLREIDKWNCWMLDVGCRCRERQVFLFREVESSDESLKCIPCFRNRTVGLERFCVTEEYEFFYEFCSGTALHNSEASWYTHYDIVVVCRE